MSNWLRNDIHALRVVRDACNFNCNCNWCTCISPPIIADRGRITVNNLLEHSIPNRQRARAHTRIRMQSRNQSLIVWSTDLAYTIDWLSRLIVDWLEYTWSTCQSTCRLLTKICAFLPLYNITIIHHTVNTILLQNSPLTHTCHRNYRIPNLDLLSLSVSS